MNKFKNYWVNHYSNVTWNNRLNQFIDFGGQIAIGKITGIGLYD